MIASGDEYRQMSNDLIDLHIAHLRAAGQSRRTIEARQGVLRRLYDRLPWGLCYAATEQIEAWLADLTAKGRSRWTLSIYAYHVRAFYRWATSAGFLDGDPTATIPAPRIPRCVPKPVTEEELWLVLSLPEPFGTAGALAGFAGLRVSEIAACRREHITAEMLTVISGKGGHPGTVPTHPYVWERIRDMPPGLLVTNHRGEPVTGQWITVSIRWRLDKIGLRGVHMHRLRHWYGTTIQRLTGDIRVTQECLRHQHVGSTQGYTLVSDGQRAAAVAALPLPGNGARAGS